MTTKIKRRKVWVKFDEFETGDDPVVYFNKRPRTRPMVERLHGDVMLSREELETSFVAWGYQLLTAKKLAAFLARRSRR